MLILLSIILLGVISEDINLENNILSIFLGFVSHFFFSFSPSHRDWKMFCESLLRTGLELAFLYFSSEIKLFYREEKECFWFSLFPNVPT